MELTQEYFDSVVKNLATKDELNILASKDDLKALASKEDLKPLATRQDVTGAVDELARIVGDGLLGERQFLEEKLDVRERVQQVESDLRKIKLALRIT